MCFVACVVRINNARRGDVQSHLANTQHRHFRSRKPLVMCVARHDVDCTTSHTIVLGIKSSVCAWVCAWVCTLCVRHTKRGCNGSTQLHYVLLTGLPVHNIYERVAWRRGDFTYTNDLIMLPQHTPYVCSRPAIYSTMLYTIYRCVRLCCRHAYYTIMVTLLSLRACASEFVPDECCGGGSKAVVVWQLHISNYARAMCFRNIECTLACRVSRETRARVKIPTNHLHLTHKFK